MTDFIYWDKDYEQGLDVPMISPHLIPPYHTQSWSYEYNRWIIKSNKNMQLNQRYVDNVPEHGDNVVE